MLLLSRLIFIFGKITISFKTLFLKQFCSLKGAFHLHFSKEQEPTPSETDWSFPNHVKIAGHRPAYKKKYSDN